MVLPTKKKFCAKIAPNKWRGEIGKNIDLKPVHLGKMLLPVVVVRDITQLGEFGLPQTAAI